MYFLLYPVWVHLTWWSDPFHGAPSEIQSLCCHFSDVPRHCPKFHTDGRTHASKTKARPKWRRRPWYLTTITWKPWSHWGILILEVWEFMMVKVQCPESQNPWRKFHQLILYLRPIFWGVNVISQWLMLLLTNRKYVFISLTLILEKCMKYLNQQFTRNRASVVRIHWCGGVVNIQYCDFGCTKSLLLNE